MVYFNEMARKDSEEKPGDGE
jgi:hypothetical protein